MEWLADAGHECRILTTARFESPVTFTIEEHLAGRGVALDRLEPRTTRSIRHRKSRTASRPVAHYAVGAVPVTLLLTRHNDESRPDRDETAQFLALLERCSTTSLPTSSSPPTGIR